MTTSQNDPDTQTEGVELLPLAAASETHGDGRPDGSDHVPGAKLSAEDIAIEIVNTDKVPDKTDGQAAAENTHTDATRFLAVVFYVSISCGLILVNKVLFQKFKFRATPVLMLSQLTATQLILRTLAFFQVISLPTLSYDVVLTMLPVSLSFMCALFCQLIALRSNPILLFGALRRCVPTTTAIAEYIFYRRVPHMITICGICLTVLGATTMVVAHGAAPAQTTGVTSTGLLALIGSILATTSQGLNVKRVRERKATEGTGPPLDVASMVYMDSMLCYPFVFMYAVSTSVTWGEGLDHRAMFEYGDSIGFWITFIASSCAGLVLNFASFRSTSLNSPTTTSISGVFKDVLIAMIGVLILGESLPKPRMIGLTLSFMGGSLYAYSKVKFRQPSK